MLWHDVLDYYAGRVWRKAHLQQSVCPPSAAYTQSDSPGCSTDVTSERFGPVVRGPMHWRRGVVIGCVRRMNEVNARRARLYLAG